MWQRSLSLAVLALPTLLVPTGADEPNESAKAAFAAIQADWNEADQKYLMAIREAKTADERRKVTIEKQPKPSQFADRFLRMAEAHPGTSAELTALFWVVQNAPESEAGRKALGILKGGRIARSSPDELFDAINHRSTTQVIRPRALAPVVLARVKQTPDHPKAARLLTWVCVVYFNDDSPEVPPTFAEAADLIVERFADSPDLVNFCEVVGSLNGYPPPWAGKYEKHLRTILDKNQHSKVRRSARFALATVVRAAGKDRQDEAERLFQQFVTDFDGKTKDSVDELLLHTAKAELVDIRKLGLGKVAPKTVGKDLNGTEFKLSDYKGKVVLLVFWASWCRPCMAAVPHERELVERFRDRPFVLIGVNGDETVEAAKMAVEKAGINWRSFQNGANGDIAEAWNVQGWPTVYEIDHAGVIRYKRLHGKQLDEPLKKLVTEAEEAAKARR